MTTSTANPNSGTDQAAQLTGQAQQPDPLQVRDVAAQEDMAFWALWMFVAAVATFAITSMGTILIWRQVKLTRQAVADTADATEAMREANQISRRMMENQNRAWLELEITSVSDLEYEEESGVFRLKVEFNVRNIGDTVARKVSTHVDMIPGAIGMHGREHLEETLASGRRFPREYLTYDIFPSKHLASSYSVIFDPKSLHEHFLEGDCFPITLVLWTSYNTIYDDEGAQRHETCSLYSVGRQGPNGTQLLIIGRKTVPVGELALKIEHLLQGHVT